MNIGLDEQGFNSPRLQNLRRSEHAVGDSGTRLRNPQLQRSSQCRFDFRCAAIREIPVRGAECTQQCNRLRAIDGGF